MIIKEKVLIMILMMEEAEEEKGTESCILCYKAN